MRRFFVASDAIADGVVRIAGRDARHIMRALRMGAGDRLSIVDSAGREYIARISRTAETTVAAVIEEERGSGPAEPHVPLTLAQGIPKFDKMDLIVQKCTEIGVSRFLPVLTERSVARTNTDSADRKVLRWQRIAEEAAKQSGRGAVPPVEGIRGLESVLSELASQGMLLIMPWELEQDRNLRRTLADADLEIVPGIAVIIGPEGGFSHCEVELAKSYGALTVTLGKRILRTETAGLAAATVIMYELGEFG
jgi:16S rRNA (uracil1498-N3)-methyltransferase